MRKGDPMLKLDLDYLRENAPSVASPVLCTELEDNQKIRLLNEGEIKAGDELFAIDIYEAYKNLMWKCEWGYDVQDRKSFKS